MPSTPLTREQEEELAAEHDDKVRACLEDEGFRTVDGKDGAGWEVDQGGLDDETFEGVLTMCNERVGWVTFAPVTSEEASGMYDLTLGVKACLEAHGVTVEEPPSREDWVESYIAGEPPWSPYTNGDPQAFARFSGVSPEPTLADLPLG